MPILERHLGLYTDHYELTMAQGYLLSGRKDTPACFDYFFRKNPFNGGYVVFAGLSDLLDLLENLCFDEEDCRYLKSIGFDARFVEYLKGFRFTADIYAPEEGEIVFPYEPVVRVEGNIIESQIIETMLLNILNFESLIATKASRMRQAAVDRLLIDFGLRRAQGTGGILASRAAVIGGLDGTSNVYSAFMYGLKSAGTQAHSWVQTFDDEIDAFRTFAELMPERCVLLADTYDTLRSGIPNAIIVAKEMEQRGERLFGVRLDSGDLAALSRKARKMLDNAGLNYVRIMSSNQLDEYAIRELLAGGAPIDAFGIGTKLVTGQADAALDGVYKLSMSGGRPRLKISETPEKIILPGVKNVLRFVDAEGSFYSDCIALHDEGRPDKIYGIRDSDKGMAAAAFNSENLFHKVMERGKKAAGKRTPSEISGYVRSRLGRLRDACKRFDSPEVYNVGLSGRLRDLRATLIDEAVKKAGGR